MQPSIVVARANTLPVRSRLARPGASCALVGALLCLANPAWSQSAVTDPGTDPVYLA